VSSVSYLIWQRYRYAYSAPVYDIRHRLKVIPPSSHLDQRLVRHELEVAGAVGNVEVEWGVDRFGNLVCTVHVDRVDSHLEFIAEYEVTRGASHALANRSDEPVLSEVEGSRTDLRPS